MTYRVVVGVDGSAHGDAALRWALAEAEAHDGEVTAVFAWQVPFLSIPGAFDKEELEQAAKNFLIEKVSAIASPPKVPLMPLVAEGDPAEALVVASKEADLLVVGTRGRSPFMGAVLGAVSLRCAASATCPVTLVKLPGEEPELEVSPGPAAASSRGDNPPDTPDAAVLAPGGTTPLRPPDTAVLAPGGTTPLRPPDAAVVTREVRGRRG